MLKIKTAFFAIIGMLALSACASMPQTAGYSNAPMAHNTVYANEDCGPMGCRAGSNQNPQRLVPPEAVQHIARYSVSCAEDVGGQVPGPIQSTVSGAVNGLPYALMGPVASAVYGSGVSATDQGVLYGASGVIGNAVGGLTAGSAHAAAGKGTCVRDKWWDVRREFPGVHVGVASGGKALSPRVRVGSPTGAAAIQPTAPMSQEEDERPAY